MARGTVQIDTNRCKGCELCVHACPQHVLHLSATYNTRGYRAVTLDETTGSCTGCAICALVCPDMIFTVYRAPVHQRRAA
jgi:2-oxoglutarate ferredoxin oxidoreductase subunit delta